MYSIKEILKRYILIINNLKVEYMKAKNKNKLKRIWAIIIGIGVIVGIATEINLLLFENKKKPISIELMQITPYLQSGYMTTGDFFGKKVYDKAIFKKDIFSKVLHSDIKLELYFLSTVINLNNPNNNPITLSDFELGFDFSAQDNLSAKKKNSRVPLKYWESNKYTIGPVEEQKTYEGKIFFSKINSPFYLKENEEKNIDIHFIIPLGKEGFGIQKIVDQKLKFPIKRIAIICRDNERRIYGTFKMLLSDGELYKIKEVENIFNELNKDPINNRAKIEDLKSKLRSMEWKLKE